MKKNIWHILTALTCLLSWGNGLAQQTEVDSLNQASYQEYREDVSVGKALAYKALFLAQSAKLNPQIVDSYVNLGRCFRLTSQWDSAYSVLEQAIEIADATGYDKGRMNAINNLGLCYLWQGDDDTALPLFKQTLVIAQEIGDYKGQANAFNNLFIIVSEDVQQSDSALSLLSGALDAYRAIEDSTGIARIYANKALLLDDIEQNDSAIYYCFKALRLQESLGLRYQKAGTYHQIGLLYTEKDQYAEAYEWYEKALKIYTDVGDVTELAIIHLLISSNLIAQKKMGEVYTYLEKGLEYSRQTEDPYLIGGGLLPLATWYKEHEKDYEKARKILEEAIPYLEEASTIELSTAYNNLGKIALEQNKLTVAEGWFERELETAESFQELDSQSEALQNLVRLHERMGNIPKAYAYQKRFQHIKDSLLNQQALETIDRLNIEFETEKKEKENLQLQYNLSQSELEATQQRALRNQLLGIAGLVLLLGLGGFIWYRYRQRIRMREQEIELERERAMQEQRRKEAEKLRELDAMKTRFFTNISHEFRTPLTLILGQNEQVQEALEDSRLINRLEVSRRNGHRLLDLVNQVLDVAKLEAGGMELEPQRLDAIPFLKHMLYSFESMAEEREIGLHFQSEIKALETAFDPQKIERVIFNLLSNAMKFTPAGGQVSLGVKQIGKELEIAVSDSGVGIKASQLPNIFDRFYQADSSENQPQPGTGIGLSLVKELIELHGGNIEVSSELNQGTTFTFRLPIPEEVTAYPLFAAPAELDPSALPDKAVIAEKGAETRGQKAEQILLIEDNPDVRAFVKEQIVSFGYQVHEAPDGKAGLEKARELIPDLIISDIMMPHVDGYGVAKGLKEDPRTSHIPLVLLTSKASDESRIAGLELGVDDYLLKPFNAKELEVRIHNLIEQRKRLRERFSTATVIRPNEVSADSMDQTFLKGVLETIEHHLGDEQFGVELLGEEVGLSVNHLNRKLNALIDQTAGKLIKSMRLQRAADLIKQQAGSISEIAYDTGFSSPTDFSRSFKKQFGMSPSAYMKKGD